jgi:hypothetical protein
MKTKLFTFRMEADAFDALRRESERTGAKEAEIARRAIDAWLRRASTRPARPRRTA